MIEPSGPFLSCPAHRPAPFCAATCEDIQHKTVRSSVAGTSPRRSARVDAYWLPPTESRDLNGLAVAWISSSSSVKLGAMDRWMNVTMRFVGARTDGKAYAAFVQAEQDAARFLSTRSCLAFTRASSNSTTTSSPVPR